VKIREIVKRLEEIEQVSDEKSIELVTSLIDDIIEFDLHMEKLFDKITKDSVEQDMMEFLMEHGIKSGSIGEA
jgi:predicted RND superfamily exporter protein